MALTNGNYDALPQIGYIQGFWRFEDNFLDLSANANNLTETSGTVDYSASGKIGKAADFESDDTEYLEIAHASCASLQITGNLTICSWINVESFPAAEQAVVAKRIDTGNNLAYYLGTNDTGGDKVAFEISSNGSARTTILGNTTLNTATWYHIACVYDGSFIYVYLNGSSDQTPAAFTTGIYNANTPFNIGASKWGGAPTGYYDGLIDEAIVWNTALTPGEILQVYNIQSMGQYTSGGGGCSPCDPMMI